MKILLYAPAAGGGHAEYTFELLRGLAATVPPAWELHLLTREGLAPEFHSDQWTIHEALPPLPPRGGFRSRAGWAANRLGYNMREARILPRVFSGDWDVVHFQEVSPFFHRGLLRRPRGRQRFVYTVHNLQPHKRLAAQLANAYDRLSAAAWARFDGLVFHSERLRANAGRQLPGFRGRSAVIPHGIWSVTPSARPVERGDRPVRLLFAGVIRANKGLHLLLDAMADLPRAELTIAGAIIDPAYFQTEVQPRLARLQTAGARITTDFAFVEKDRMIGYLEAADYLVLPYSAFESQSGMLMYAMACGVPVIASDVGALGETVALYGVGRTYPPERSDGLLTALQSASVAESRALRAQVRRYAQEHAWTKVATRHAEFYRTLLAAPAEVPRAAVAAQP